MESLLSFFKDFFVLTLILSIFSYLVPGKNYRKYMQFFIGIMMAVILLKPIGKLVLWEEYSQYYHGLEELEEQLEEIRFEPGEEGFVEFLERDGETDTTEVEEME